MAISLLPFLIVLSSATFSSGTWLRTFHTPPTGSQDEPQFPKLPPPNTGSQDEQHFPKLPPPNTESQDDPRFSKLPPLTESQAESHFPRLPSSITESQVAVRFKSWANKGTARSFLKAHNELRANYGVKPLRWDRGLARAARRWAYAMHNACSLTHSHTNNGENIFIGKGKWTIKEAMEEWAKERYNYHWKDNSCNPNKMCGHFKQMIWDKTEAVGCAKIRCNATFVFVTCDYRPSGNIRGHWPIQNHQKFV